MPWDAVKKLGDDFFANALDTLELTAHDLDGLWGCLANLREITGERLLGDDSDRTGDGADASAASVPRTL